MTDPTDPASGHGHVPDLDDDDDTKRIAGRAIVRTHAIAAVAAGLIPVPFAGGGLLGVIHLRMIRQLATLYEVEFSEQRAKSILAALLGISATVTAASLLRMVPGIGMLGALTPSASTYAVGEVFIKHFASGGTFLTFDPHRAKAIYDATKANGSSETSYAGIKP